MDDDNAAHRVTQELRASVACAAPGARLPSVRELMARHRVSPLTVQNAIHRLAAEGLVDARPGRGTFVAARPEPAQPPPTRRPADLSWQTVSLGERKAGEEAMQQLLAVPRPAAISLSSGYPDSALQPVTALSAALVRAARRPASWQRGPVEGSDELRAWFAAESHGALRAHDMVVCPGGQAALSTAFRALTTPGDAVLVEAPTYLGAIAAARAAGLRVVQVPADDAGVRPDLLADAFARTAARLFYCQPAFANPHGAVLTADRRAAVLDAAAAAGAFIVEDDWARDLGIDDDPPLPLAADDRDGRVVYVRALTKSAAPGLRIAGIGARGAAGARLRAARVLDDFFVSGPLQEAALEFISSPAWRRHRRALRAALRQRRGALLAALREHLPAVPAPSVPGGGLHLWLRLPEDVDDVALAAEANRHDVVVSPGRSWFAAEPPAPYLRLTFAAAPAEILDEGVTRLAAALHALR